MKKIIISFLIILNLSFFNHSYALFDVNAKTAILQDYFSGEILYEKEVDYKIYPASMTKIMTSIIAFDYLKRGEISLEDKFLISEEAWRLSKPGYSSMFIMENDEISVENLLKGIIIVSGNDACIALAEGIAGSEEEFALLMTSKAAEIGMANTNFTNSSGINDPGNYSTVKDILIMSNYLIKNYPEYYTYFKELEFTWDRTGGDPITQPNTNALLFKNTAVDGIKTGYLAVEKYSLASSIFKNNRRLIAVGSGFVTKASRTKESNKLLNYGLIKFDTVQVTKKNNKFSSLEVWLGKKKKVDVYINEDIFITISKGKKRFLSAYIEYVGPIHAPIKKDQKVAILNIFKNEELISSYDVLAMHEVKKVNIISRIMQSFNFLIWGDA